MAVAKKDQAACHEMHMKCYQIRKVLNTTPHIFYSCKDGETGQVTSFINYVKQ